MRKVSKIVLKQSLLFVFSTMAIHAQVVKTQAKANILISGVWQLYDLSKDRSETNDLASNNPELIQALSKSW